VVMKKVFGISVDKLPTNLCRASAHGSAGILPAISGMLPGTFCAF